LRVKEIEEKLSFMKQKSSAPIKRLSTKAPIAHQLSVNLEPASLSKSFESNESSPNRKLETIEEEK
jgi:hypothetical protein